MAEVVAQDKCSRNRSGDRRDWVEDGQHRVKVIEIKSKAQVVPTLPSTKETELSAGKVPAILSVFNSLS